MPVKRIVRYVLPFLAPALTQVVLQTLVMRSGEAVGSKWTTFQRSGQWLQSLARAYWSARGFSHERSDGMPPPSRSSIFQWWWLFWVGLPLAC